MGVASCGVENEVIFYNLNLHYQPRLAHTLAYETKRRLPDCRALAFSSDSKRLALGAWDEVVRVYRTDIPMPRLEYEMRKTHMGRARLTQYLGLRMAIGWRQRRSTVRSTCGQDSPPWQQTKRLSERMDRGLSAGVERTAGDVRQ